MLLTAPWLDAGPEDDDDNDLGSDAEAGRSADELQIQAATGADMAGPGGYPGFSLEYELVPGLPPVMAEMPRHAGRDLVRADVPMPRETSDGGAIAPYEGGPVTHGSRGSWPLPPDARLLTFTLVPPPVQWPPDPGGH